MISPCEMTIYFTSRMRYQTTLVLDILENINEGFDISDPDTLIENSKYQEGIKQRLKICIKRHTEIQTTGKTLVNGSQAYTFLMSIAGVIIGVSIIFFLFSFEGSFEKRYPRLVTLVISAGLTFTHIIIAGQLVENIATKFFEILQAVDWHYWNQQNRNILIIFMQNTQQVFQINFLDDMAVNYQLGISIAQSVYSMISVLRSLKNLDDS
ncbi:uncharacterized protein LOC123014896 [Tribolium madens]|uniref:uncharacterized protein LOC123014896 n=1 Tax=Tribolium madens TaxID=41895 RepID=UPI001CF71FAB|nr:uncharacterized protein LOC123014896 [Tribolium madens]